MTLEQIRPFVRQAIITNISCNTKEDVFYELQSSDCRLFYIMSGEGCMTIKGETYRLSPGCTLLFKAGTKYIWQPSGERAIEFIVLNFDYTHSFTHIKKPFHPVHSDRFTESDILENHTFTDCDILNSPIVVDNLTSIEARLRLMTTEFNVANDFCLDELLSSILKSVIISIIREKNISPDEDGNRELALTRSIIQYIQNNYDKDLSYESLARTFFMNPVYMNRIFKKNSGTSIHAFLVNYRINMAMELLRSSNIPVREIAFAAGFTDIPHFAKTFKRITGVSPSNYRSTGNISAET